MATQPTTKQGTPISPRWDDDWVAQVQDVERQLGRRICGAHSPAWTPCKLGSTHPNGRCRYHGGHPNIGAPLGNKNAIIHGLYARRLQQCGDHCALWHTCPMPNKDLDALPPKERPYCVYEQEEYDHIIDALEQASQPQDDPVDYFDADPLYDDESDHESPPLKGDQGGCSQSPPLKGDKGGCDNHESTGPTLLHHNIATLQVMLTRAQAALGINQYTQETRADGDKYSMRSTKVSALL